MGRKGVSKRKPHQPKNRLLSKENASAGVSSFEQAIGSPLVQPFSTEKSTAPATRGNKKNASDSRKNPKKR